jgi:hypothetical protein
MTKVTVKGIDTENGTTDLPIGTGNTDASFISVNSNGSLVLASNSTSNVFTINSDSSINVLSTTITLTGNSLFNSNATFSTNNVLLGNSSLAANGYAWLPNKLLVQWGKVSANNSTKGNTTFSVPFPTACLGISLTGIANTANIAYCNTTPNTTVALIRTNEATATGANVSYIALGY